MTVFDEIKAERDREQLAKLRAARAEHKRLREIADKANKEALEAANAWSLLYKAASEEVRFEHAQDPR